MCSNPSELPVECGKFCERSDDFLRLFLDENVQDCRGNVRFHSIRVVSEEGLFEGVPIRWCGMKLRSTFPIFFFLFAQVSSRLRESLGRRKVCCLGRQLVVREINLKGRMVFRVKSGCIGRLAVREGNWWRWYSSGRWYSGHDRRG